MKKNKWITAALMAMLMCCAISATACNNEEPDSSGNSTPGQVEVQPSIALSVETMSITQFDTAVLTYTLTGMSASTAVAWESSDSSIVSVDSEGNLMAYKVGTAIITATAGECSDTVSVTVTASTDFPSLSLSQVDAKLKVGGSVTVYPTVMFRGDEVDDQPTITWNTTSEAISLTEKADGSVTIAGISAVENAIVTAKTTYLGKELVQAVTVTVTEDIEFAIDKTEAQLYTYTYGTDYAETLTLNSTVTLNGVVDEDAVVAWSSDTESVAMVENGVVTAVSAGEATITATYEASNGTTYTKECIVTVSVPSIKTGRSAKIYLNSADGDQVVNITEELGIGNTALAYKVIDVASGAEVDATLDGANLTFNITDKKLCGERAIKFVVEGKVEIEATVTVVTKVLMTADEVANIKNYGVLEDVTDTGYTLYGYFLLGADVDLSSAGEIGIRNYAAGDSKGFIGGFDGQGHTIANMMVTGSGLFGEIAQGTVIRNTAFMDVYVNSDLSGALGKTCHGVIENCLIDIGFTHGVNMNNCSGVVDSINGEGAAVRNCVVYYPETSYKSNAISRYLINGGKYENVAVIGEERFVDYDNKTNTSVTNVTRYAKDTALMDVDFSFVTGDYWKFDGEKVYFAGYDALIKEMVNSGEYPTSLTNGESATLSALPADLEYVLEIADEYKDYVTLDGLTLTISNEIDENFSFAITVSKWNGIDLEVSKTVNIVKIENIVVKKSAEYLLYTSAGVANTTDFVADYSDELSSDIPAALTWKVLKSAEEIVTITDNVVVAGKTISVPAAVLFDAGLYGEYTLLGQSADGNYKIQLPTVFITQIIDSAEELSAFVAASQTGCYILGDNIDASSLTIKNTNTFTGTFDGRGYAIDGLTTGKGGLFGTISAGSTVKNLALTNAKISAGAWDAPSLMGTLYGTIDNCYFELVEVNNESGASYPFDGAGNRYAAAVCSNIMDGGVVQNIVLKAVSSGYSHNICVSMLGTSAITNAYVIGGVAKELNWNQSGSPVSVTHVTTLTEGQQATLNAEIWGFEDGVPYFKKTRVDLSTAIALDCDAQKIYANEGEGTQEIVLSELGVSGTVEKVYNSTGKMLGFSLTANGFTVSGVTGGTQLMYIVVGGTLYSFSVNCVSNVITTAEELATFASASQTGYFELGANIDASSLTVNNVGAKFTGTFDGRGYAIDGMTVAAATDTEANGALFGAIGTGSIVKNLALTGVKINAHPYATLSPVNGNQYLYGTLQDCYIEIVSKASNMSSYDASNIKVHGVVGHMDDGDIYNVVVKSNFTLTYNICNMLLDRTDETSVATIRNTYVIGTGTNTGWNENSAGSISITNVTNTTGELPDLATAGFNTEIWTASVGNRPQFKGIEYALTEDGLSEYCIIRDSDAISIEAAEVIQKYFKEATGVELTILDKSEYANLTAHYISVGYTYQMANITGLWNMMGCGTTGEDELGLGTNGYIVDTVDGNVYIMGYYKGNNLHGTLNGAYAWLNAQFGLEIYADDDYVIDIDCTDEKLEVVNTVTVPDIPAVIGGNSDSYGEESMGFYAMNGGDGLIAGAYGNNIYPFHNFLGFLPQSPEKTLASNPAGVTVDLNYGELLGTAPKNNFDDGYSYYYDNVYDNRCVYDLCLSQNQDTVISYLMDRMATLIASVSAKHQTYIAFTHEDGSYWCPHCRQKFAAGGTGYATETEYLTAEYTKFMIKLANAMKQDGRFDNITLVMAHYGLTSNLPVSGSAGAYTLDAGIQQYMTNNSLSLPDNLAVIVSYTAVNNYAGEEDFSSIADIIAKWQTVTDKFLGWTYIENYSNYFAPFDGVEQIQVNMQFAKASGIQLYFPQGMTNIGSTSIDWGALENYVISKLMWDVDADVDALIDDFFNNYYGAAATTMKSLYSNYKLKMKSLTETYGFGGTYNLLSKNGVDYVSTTCWTQTELEGFLNQIKAAKADVLAAKNDGSISEAEYDVLNNRITVEELTFKYMYIKLYSSAAVTYYNASSSSSLQTLFVDECKALGVTNFSESQELTASIF